MNVYESLELVAPLLGDRPVVTDRAGSVTLDELDAGARRVAAWLAGTHAGQLVLIDVNSRTVPLALFGAANAGIPFTPVNYRLTDDRLQALLVRTARRSSWSVTAWPGGSPRSRRHPRVSRSASDGAHSVV